MVIYIHIPFCIKKCYYCDFLSGASDEKIRKKYVTALINEIKYYGKLYKNKEKVTSVFFGGGTPSILEPIYIEEILKELRQNFNIEESAVEITVECNPGTINEEKLSIYKRAGVNRLSIGLQSANDKELKRIGRIHTFEEFLNGYKMARELGFNNINIDLMSALPDQTIESYEDTLKKVVMLKPEHISAYSLILEEGTCLYEEIEALENAGKETGLPGEEAEREMYYKTKEILEENGYNRYEISNYAKAGYECRHNMAYWLREDYIGMGIGAASCIDGSRTKNIEDLHEYIKCMESITSALNSDETVILSDKDKMSEFMFLGLRLTKGISKETFKEQFDITYDEVYGEITRKLVKEGLILEVHDRICLTELGTDVSNVVMAEFLLDQNMGYHILGSYCVVIYGKNVPVFFRK